MHVHARVQDHASIAAVIANKKKLKFMALSAIGFGIDFFHGLHHALFLENVSDQVPVACSAYL